MEILVIDLPDGTIRRAFDRGPVEIDGEMVTPRPATRDELAMIRRMYAQAAERERDRDEKEAERWRNTPPAARPATPNPTHRDKADHYDRIANAAAQELHAREKRRLRGDPEELSRLHSDILREALKALDRSKSERDRRRRQRPEHRRQEPQGRSR